MKRKEFNTSMTYKDKYKDRKVTLPQEAEEVKVVAGMSMTIPEMLKRYRSGQSIPLINTKNGYDEDQEVLAEMDNPDELTRMDEIKELNKTLNSKVEKRKKAREVEKHAQSEEKQTTTEKTKEEKSEAEIPE